MNVYDFCNKNDDLMQKRTKSIYSNDGKIVNANRIVLCIYVCITIAAVENNQTFFFSLSSHRMCVFVTNAQNGNGLCQMVKCVRLITMPIG